MSRIFISYSRRDLRYAVALKEWIAGEDPGLRDEIFVDVDPDTGIMPGVRWREALKRANNRCEAVICLLTKNWESSTECRTEFRTAENLNKLIFCARLESEVGEDLTTEWQYFDLFGGDSVIEVGSGADAVSFSAEGLHRLLRGIKQAGIGVTSFPWPPPGQPDRAPYRGWEPFESGDAGVFFGRDAEVVLAMDALRGMRQSGKTLFVVMAASGAGKSSFLRAGIVPRLQKDDRNYLVLNTVRPEMRALTGVSGLAQAISATRHKFGLLDPPLGDIKDACTRGDVTAVRGWLTQCSDAATGQLLDTADGEPPAIVVPLDQAEELFSGDIPEATGLLALIRGLALGSDTEARMQLIVAATIRTDRYDRLQEALQGRDLQTEKFDLCAMDVTQFENVITGPARRSTESGQPLHLDEQLVQRLLSDASGSADALPLLSLTLAWLYRDYGSTGRLTLAPYAERGMGSVVQTEIDSLLSADHEERAHQLDILRSAFIPWLARINPLSNEPMRRLAKWTNLPEASRPLIAEFVAKRLLVSDERDGEIVVEVALESLLRQWPELQTWLERDRESLKAADDIERDAQRWEARGRDHSRLISGTSLAEAETLAAAAGYRDLLAPAADFLVASRQMETAEQEKEKQRQQRELDAAREKQATAERNARTQRRLNRLLIALVAVAVVVALAAVSGFRNASNSQKHAAAEKKVAHAQAILAGGADGDDATAFRDLVDAYAVLKDGGPLLDALAKRVSTVRLSDTHAAAVGVAFSEQSHRLAVINADKKIRLWHTKTPTWRERPLDEVQTLISTSQDHFTYSSVAISPDGNSLACGRSDGTVELWDIGGTNPQSRSLKSHEHKGVVSGLAFSADGQRMASAGGADKVIDISDITGEQEHSIPTSSEVFTVAFDPRSGLLASGGSDGAIRFWNPDGTPERTIPRAHPNGVMSLAFNPTKPDLASGGNDRMVKLWHTDSLSQFDHTMGRHTEAVQGVAFNSEGTRLVSASADHSVQMWDADSGDPIGDLMIGHTEIVWAVAFVADRIISVSNDHFVRVWDGNVGQPISAPLRGHEGPVTSVAINGGADRIASASADRTIRIWDLHTGFQVGDPLAGHTGAVTGVAFNPRGDTIASGSADGTIRLWRTSSHELIGTLEVGQPVYSVAFSPSGDRLAFAAGDCHVGLWDLASTKPTPLSCDGHGAVLAVAFSPKGGSVAAGGVDGKLRVWGVDGSQRPWAKDILDPLSDETKSRFNLATGRPGVVTSIAFSPDGARVASGSSMWRSDESPSGVIQRWDAATGQASGEPMHPPEGSVMAVAFSPPIAGNSANRIVAGDSDYTVRLWDADSKAATEMGAPLHGHQNGVISVAFTPGASCIVSGSMDGTIRIWPNAPTSAPADALRNKLS
jgi:WD40 repeat protein